MGASEFVAEEHGSLSESAAPTRKALPSQRQSSHVAVATSPQSVGSSFQAKGATTAFVHQQAGSNYPPERTTATTANINPAAAREQSHEAVQVRPRRSRYATLPKNVDSALRVLYVELESASELKQKVAGLEAQVSSLQREMELQKKEVALARKAAEKSRITQDELEKLRSEAAGRQAAVEEAEALRGERQAGEAELEKCKEQLASLTDTLHDWKQKLSGLVGE